MTSLETELETARTIALEAAVVVSRFREGELRVESKAGNEPVTEADRAANALIVERLQQCFPDDVVLSEEIPDDGSRHGRHRVWMVDPIDGTSDFIAGDSGYAVMIGLCIGGRPLLGVVAQPVTGKTYGGIVGEGAWLEEPGRGRRSLKTSSLAASPGIRLVASKTHRTPKVDKIRQALGVTDEVNIGSVGLKIGLVAEDLRDLYIYTGGRTKVWDTCGPEAILLAAGGSLTDMDGQPLDYTSTDLYNKRGLVASNGPLHPFVLRTLRDILAQNAD